MYPDIKAPNDLSVFDIVVSNVIIVFSSIAFFDCFNIVNNGIGIHSRVGSRLIRRAWLHLFANN